MIIVKPRTSPLSSNQRFIVCQGLKRELARKLGEILLASYTLARERGVQLFDARVMTQDVKFCENFIEKFSRNLVNLQVDYFQCEEAKRADFLSIAKEEFAWLFNDDTLKDIVDTFEVEDPQLSKEIGLKLFNQ